VMAAEVGFTVNGTSVTVSCDGGALLCDVLREELDLTGTRVGCREGVCGSCNVLVDGEVVRSCLMLALQVEGCDVRTVEGLSIGGVLSALQQAFLDLGAVQCGFCTAGVLITATSLFDGSSDPGEDEILEALAGNLCRCTGYSKILEAIRAVMEAAPASRPSPQGR